MSSRPLNQPVERIYMNILLDVFNSNWFGKHLEAICKVVYHYKQACLISTFSTGHFLVLVDLERICWDQLR